jgi:hypothetical protein
LPEFPKESITNNLSQDQKTIIKRIVLPVTGQPMSRSNPQLLHSILLGPIQFDSK